MSVFSSDTDIYVSSVIYPLGEELDKIPDVVKANLIGAGMQSTSRSRAIKSSIIDGMGLKLRQAYAYAAKSYYAGLPEGIPLVRDEASHTLIRMLAEEYLTALHAPLPVSLLAVTVEYDSNYETIIHQQIETKYNYDFANRKVHTSVFGLPVNSTLQYIGLRADETLHPGESGYRLTFTKPDTTTVTFDEWYSNTLFAGQDAIENRVFMIVSINGAQPTTTSYSQGGGDARLNLFLRDLTAPRSGTFPAIVLKKWNNYLNTNKFLTNTSHPADWWKSQSAYRTSKVYGKRMNVDVDELIRVIKENPDHGEIDFAFIQPGTMINSPNQCAKEYHFDYFNRLRTLFPENKAAFDAWFAKTGATMNETEASTCPSQSIRFRDPDAVKHTVNMEMGWRYITYEVKSGTLAEPYVIECGPKDDIEIDAQSFRGVLYLTVLKRFQFTKLYLRKRLTESTYAELVVCGLWHENDVYEGTKVRSQIWDVFNDPEGDYGTGFIIPLEYEVLLGLSGRTQLQLAQEALHIIFNCYQVVKEKWYQTGIFKFVMIAFSVVVIVFTWGAAAPYVAALNGAISASLVGLGLTATVLAAVATVLTYLIVAAVVVAVQLVAKEAGEWAAEQWGPVWGAVVQVAVTIALTWGIGQLGQIYLNVPVTPMTLTQQIMNTASLIFSTLSTYTQFEMQKIQEDYALWNAGADERESQMKELEKLWEENFPEMSLPAQMWFAPLEKMDDWLARTQSTGDTLVNRLIAPIEYLSEITLTPRLQ